MPKEAPVQRECKDCFDSEYRDGAYVPSGSDRCRACRKTKRESSPSKKKAEPVLSDSEFDEKYKSVMKAVEEHEKEERERRIKIAQEL